MSDLQTMGSLRFLAFSNPTSYTAISSSLMLHL